MLVMAMMERELVSSARPLEMGASDLSWADFHDAWHVLFFFCTDPHLISMNLHQSFIVLAS